MSDLLRIKIQQLQFVLIQVKAEEPAPLLAEHRAADF